MYKKRVYLVFFFVPFSISYNPMCCDVQHDLTRINQQLINYYKRMWLRRWEKKGERENRKIGWKKYKIQSKMKMQCEQALAHRLVYSVVCPISIFSTTTSQEKSQTYCDRKRFIDSFVQYHFILALIFIPSTQLRLDPDIGIDSLP